MLKTLLMCLAVLWALPSWSQVEPSANGGPFSMDYDTAMMTPPPVSGDHFPTNVGSEARSNYLRGGIIFTADYNDNLMQLDSTRSVSDETYSILPSVSLSRNTSRQIETLDYTTGFRIYQHTSALNNLSQTGGAHYRYRISPYIALDVQDYFNQNSNAFNQSNPYSGGGVSGSTQSPSSVLIAPYQDQITNETSGGLNYQFAKDAMIGGRGNFGFVHYPKAGDSTGLYNSKTSQGSGFYSRRLSRGQYIGGIYQYSNTVTDPVETHTTTNGFNVFYTIFVSRTVSLSVMGGPQHYTSLQPPFPESSAWAPNVTGSVGWQTPRTNLAATYTRAVTGGGGLLGTFKSDTASASAQWEMTRTWSSGVGFDYSKRTSATPIFTVANEGGRSISGTISVRHRLTERLSAHAGYSHFNQSYGGISSLSQFPDSNRVFLSIAYNFTRPLGR